jgi:dye decolorizing peroxidase
MVHEPCEGRVRRAELTRRRFLATAASLLAGGRAGAALATRDRQGETPLGVQPAGLPSRQFAWAATLERDSHGNVISPRFDRLLFFDVLDAPSRNAVRTLEASLRTLERGYRWGPDGLLFTASWGPHYFEHVLGTATPIPRPKELSDFELPTFDDYDFCLHLACDDEQRLAAVELALVHGRPLGVSGALDLSSILRWRETRTGFVGAGLPAAHQHVNGIPSGDPVPASSPLFMGFKSGFTKNQAPEDEVAIADGPFLDGTTMQVSYMRLRLDSWYSMSENERVARMYAPELTPEQVSRFTDDAPSDPDRYSYAASHFGVVGHSQTSARARVKGKPRIIRRDFDTVDGGLAGLHFVSLQRSIADFVATRNAMNAANAAFLNPAIGDTVNNGINEFIFVLKRANYILAPRATRSYPLYPGQAAALA